MAGRGRLSFMAVFLGLPLAIYLVFVIYPSDDGRGLVRLEGRWSSAAEPERL